MPDNKITEVLELQGDPKGAVSALKTTSSEMAQTEKQASSFASRIEGYGSGILSMLGKAASGAGKLGVIAATGGGLAAKGFTLAGAASGVLTGSLLKVSQVAALGASTLGAFVGHGLRIAGLSDQASQLGKTWERTLNQMSAPLVNSLAQAFQILNQILQDPAVQHFLGFITGIAQAILDLLIPVLRGAAASVIAFLSALEGGDFAGAFGKALDAFGKGVRQKGQESGATFVQGFNEGVKKGRPPELPKLQAIPGGYLKDIGDLGTRALNAYLAGFRKPDLDALSATGDAIKARLQTIYQQAKLPALKIVPQFVIDQTAVARALSDLQKPGTDPDAVIQRVRGSLSALGPATQDFVEAELRGVLAAKQLEAAQAAVTTATKALSDANDALAHKQEALKGIQGELTAAQSRQATEQARLLPLSDQIRDIEQEIAQKLIDQTKERGHLAELAEQQKTIERQIADLEQEQADKLKALDPLRQAIVSATEAQHTAQLAVRDAQDAEIPLQQKLADATEAQHRAQLAVRDAQDAQIPLKEKLVELTEAQHRAELAVRDAQDSMIPILDRLNAAKEDMAALTEQSSARERDLQGTLTDQQAAYSALAGQIQERGRLTQEGIVDAQRALDDRLAAQDDLIKGVDEKYADQLNLQKEIIQAADEHWKIEKDGAQKTLDIANKALAVEERKNRANLLQFSRQRAAAQGIEDPNKRVEALARINIAEERYNNSVKDRLDAARLESQLQQDNLQVVQDKVDAEKGDAPARLADLQDLIKAEKDVIQTRIASVKEEGQERIKQLQRAAEDQKRADDALLRAGQARVDQAKAAFDQAKAEDDASKATIQARIDAVQQEQASQQKLIDNLGRQEITAARRVEAAQAEVGAQDKVIAGLQRQEVLAGRQVEAAQAEVGAQEKIVSGLQRQEVLAGRQVEAAQFELTSAEGRVHTETDGAIEAAKRQDIAIGKERSLLTDKLDGETKSARTRLDAAQNEYNLRSSYLKEAAEKENRPIEARLAAAQKEVNAAQFVSDLRQGDLTAAEKLQTAAEAVVKKQSEAADLAKTRLDLEAKNAEALDQQRNLLGQIADAQAANAKALKDYQLALAEYNKSTPNTSKGVRPAGIAPVGIEAPSVDFSAGAEAGKKFFMGLTDGWDTFWAHVRDDSGNIDWLKAGKTLGDELLGGLPKSKAAWDDLFKDFSLGKLGDFLDQLGADNGGALAGFGPFFHGIEIGWQTVSNLFDFSSPTTKALIGNINGIADKIGTSVHDTLGGIGTFINDNIIKPVGSFFGDLGSKIGDSIKNVWDIITKPFKDAYDSLLGHSTVPDIINGILSWIQKLPDLVPGILKKFVDDALAKFNDLKDKLPQPVKDMLDGIGLKFDNSKTDNSKSIDDLALHVLGVFTTLKTTVVPKVGEIVTDVGTHFDTIKTDATTKIGDLWTSITDKFAAGKIDLNTKSGEIKDKVVEQFDLLRSGSEGKVQNMSDAIKDKVDLLKTDMGTKMGLVHDAALNPLGTLATDGEGKVTDLKDKANAQLDLMKKDAGTKSQDVVDASGASFASWAAALAGSFLALNAAFLVVFGPATQEGTYLWQLTHDDAPGGNANGGFFPRSEFAIRRALNYEKTEVWLSSFNGLKGAIITFVDEKMNKDLVDKFVSLGENIAAGITRGILNGLQAAKAAGAALVDSAYTGANDAAGQPRSPAPRFVPLGQTFGQGLAQGMDRAHSFIERAAIGMVSAAQRAASLPAFGAITVPVTPGFTLPVGSMFGASGGLASTSTNTQHVNIAVQHIHNDGQDQGLGADWHRMFTR